MDRSVRAFAVLGCLLVPALAAPPALAEKAGGILRLQHRDSPPSMSIHEEATISTSMPMMGVFNNLVMFNSKEKQNKMDNIVPDLAESWSWDASKTKLTFKLRQGVKWHDGKPFTAKDVQCTWDLLTGKAKDGLRKNPRASWYTNLDSVSVKGDHEATFNLKRPQPSFVALLASGYSPVYPCHVSPRDMRLKPVGTGPFKFVEFKANEHIKVVKNPDYWKKGRPLLDGIDYTIITSRATAVLALVAGKVDMSFPYDWSIPVVKDFRNQAPNSICEVGPTNVSRNLIVNRDSPPFDNAEIRKAMVLTLDRKAFVDILDEGHTLAAIRDKLVEAGANRVFSAVLADKDTGRAKPISPDFIGVRLPNRYVFGFGMDVSGAWRNLPEIYALKED